METFLLQMLPFVLALYWYWGNVRQRSNKYPTPEVPFGYKGLPFIGFLPHFKGLECQAKLIQMKERYGKICKVRMGSFDCVWLNDYEIIKNAWKNDKFCARPDIPGILQRTNGFKGGLIFNEGADFVEQRKFVLQHLKTAGLGKAAAEEFIINELYHVVDVIDNTAQPMCTRHLFNIASFNIIWGLITGGSRFSNNDPEMNKLVEVLNRHMELNDGSRAAVFMPWLSKYFPGFIGWKNYISDANYIYNFWKRFAEAEIASYKANGANMGRLEEGRFLQAYCDKISGCTEPTSSFYGEKGVKSLATVLQDLFIAGSETTASTLQWIFLYLAAFPNIQEKVFHEILNNIGLTKTPKVLDLRSLPYTEAFIYETLRYSTLAPLGMLHSTSEDVMFSGYFIPKGTIIISNVCAVHYDKAYWNEPQIFKPERFLPLITSDNESRSTENRCKGFIPFSIGRRFCPGSTLAKQTLFLTVVFILQRYRICLSSKHYQLKPKIGISATPTPHELLFVKRAENKTEML